MPIINSLQDQRTQALWIAYRYDQDCNALDDSTLFQRVRELGFYWSESNQEWRSLPQVKLKGENNP